MGFLNDEAHLVVARINGFMATGGTVIQAAAASIMSKEGGKYFSDLLSKLSAES